MALADNALVRTMIKFASSYGYNKSNFTSSGAIAAKAMYLRFEKECLARLKQRHNPECLVGAKLPLHESI